MLRDTWKRAHPLYRCCVTAAALVVLVGVVALSTASRKPYLSQNSVTWHTSKASRMIASACREPNQVQKTEVRNSAIVESPATAARPEATPPRILPVAFRVDHPRSPPVLA